MEAAEEGLPDKSLPSSKNLMSLKRKKKFVATNIRTSAKERIFTTSKRPEKAYFGKIRIFQKKKAREEGLNTDIYEVRHISFDDLEEIDPPPQIANFLIHYIKFLNLS